jgi:hypothetical protein
MTAKDIFYSLARWSLTPPLIFLTEDEFGKVDNSTNSVPNFFSPFENYGSQNFIKLKLETDTSLSNVLSSSNYDLQSHIL